jgi:hypothetical protein
VFSGMSAVWRRLAGWCRQERSAGEAPWLARQVRDNARRVEAAEARADELAAQVAELRAQVNSTAQGFTAAFGAAGRTVPDCMAADSPTQPIILRAV